MKPNFIKLTTLGLLVFQLMVLTSCQRRLSASVYNPDNSLSKILPFYIQTNVREESLDANYQDFIVKKGTGTSYISTDPFGSFFAGFANAFTQDRYIKDERKSDTRLIIERDFANNIGQRTGTRKMVATVNIITFAEGKSINPIPAAVRFGFGTLLGVNAYNEVPADPTTGKKNLLYPAFMVTLGFGLNSTFFGIPRWRKQKAMVGVEVQLSDLQGNSIGRYSGVGQGNTKTGWYPWNYSKYGALHYSNIKAVTQAMNSIKSQIETDYDKIMESIN